ncbi:MAG: MFS transporter [Armatimonadota bacterium]|nr:MFS transporter [Armatimonadota bacterium]MDR7458172.1 MFS transporter [Armatimonadota bacterium]MDR7478520.1 MFS transporter [Armatimonadota bacterium]MDR7487691.1 MFS transporter [Armatimonadota bacterium]MDR7492028.1 MFS transporter [Armatimonadota bacterium]
MRKLAASTATSRAARPRLHTGIPEESTVHPFSAQSSSPAVQRPAGRAPWGWLALLCAAELGTMVTFASYTAAQPLLQQAWGLNAAQAGAIFAAQQAGYTVAVVALSSLTDVAGVRRVYLASAAWNAVAAALFSLGASGFPSALFLRALVGVGLAGTYMPGMRLVAETFPPHRRATALGLYVACFGAGTGLSLFVSGVLLPLGVRRMLLLTALGPALALLLAWGAVRDPVRGVSPRRPPFRAALRNAAALRYIGAYAAHNWELFGMRAWIPVYLAALWTAQGLPLPDASRLATSVGSAVLLAGAISNAAGGWVGDRLGRQATVVLILSASAACSAVIGWLLPLGPRVVLPVAVVYGLLVTAESSTLSSAVAEHAPVGALGTTMAVQSSLGFIATILGPALFGLLLDRTGWGWAFLSLAVPPLLGAALVGAARPSRGPAAAARPGPGRPDAARSH